MASTAAAQTATPQTTTNPTFELQGGYQWLYITDDPGTNFPFGLAVDAARNFGSLGVVAEGGWSIRSEGDDPDDVLFNYWHAGGGVRFSSRRNVKVWPYAQVLAGVAVHNASGDVGGIDVGDTSTHFMVQPGGGVNFVIGDGLGLFAAADYRRVFMDEDTDGTSGLNEFRIFVGLRMILD
jgi:hypothetical protein